VNKGSLAADAQGISLPISELLRTPVTDLLITTISTSERASGCAAAAGLQDVNPLDECG
jgi:hypothetical protein